MPHPGVELGLGLLEAREPPALQQLLADRLVQALDLAGRCGRVRRGEQVADPVVHTDPVEGDGRRLVSEPAGEDLAVVGQDLIGRAVA